MDDYVPDFENPYPDAGWAKISSFEYETPLVLHRSAEAVRYRGGKEDADYIVAEPYSVRFKLDGESRRLTVPKGLLTDLSSVPWWARWLVGRVGPHLEASIVHDFLYVAWQDLADHDARKEDWTFADRLMLEGLKQAKVHPIRRVFIYLPLRLFGWWVYKGRNAPPRYHELG